VVSAAAHPGRGSRRRADDGSLWLLDGGYARAVDEAGAAAWRLDPAAAEVLSAADLAALPAGPPLRPRPLLVTDGAERWLVDDALGEPGAGGSTGQAAGGIPARTAVAAVGQSNHPPLLPGRRPSGCCRCSGGGAAALESC